MRRPRLATLLLLLLATPLLAQKKQVTLEAVYDPTTRVFFSGAIQSGFDWIDDKTFIWPKKDEEGEFVEWRLFDVTTGKQRPLLDRAKLQKTLESMGLSADDAADAVESEELTFD